jgi:3D (Asp-Asp-Asp) domain-containing protein
MKKAMYLLTLSMILGLLFSFPAFAAQTRKNQVTAVIAQDSADLISGPSSDVAGGSAHTEAGNPLLVEPHEEKTAMEGKYLGSFKTTGYWNSNGSHTASGSWPYANHTVAADWSILPAGSKIRFGGSDIVYTVEDSGVSGNTIDVYYNLASEADSHGVQYKDVYILN